MWNQPENKKKEVYNKIGTYFVTSIDIILSQEP